ncbi:MAG: homocysteine biosynthesis protein [Thermodesulfobacteriota bacterium]|nr:homocysteine biosynthesis protein [Thermodesulfobacteriota bacterium]
MTKTIAEINEKIKKGKAVVVTAEEINAIVREKGEKKAASDIDIVTTGTFGPMCSSSAYLNLGHSKPRIKIGGGRAYLNDVPVYTGIAAVDIYIGATAIPDGDPRNAVFPGAFRYGGGHVIEELVAGKDIRFSATSYVTDCYPKKSIDTYINIKNINETVLFNPRNSYQNYNVAVNLSDRIIYTYMGTLQPNLGNANYCSAGQLSPLLNDPYYRTIGIGTRIFLGGAVGYVVWNGTQHNPCVSRTKNGVPRVPAGTLAVIGNLKEMNTNWLRGTTLTGYGATLSVGIGVPIPLLTEEILRFTTVTDEDIFTQVVDYSDAYPQGKPDTLGEVNYAQLRSGKITVQNKEIKTASLSSYVKAREIAQTLKNWIIRGDFFLSEPVASLPSIESGITFKPMPSKSVKKV